MHPILFKIPLPSFNLPYAWIPFLIAALAVMVAIAKMVGKTKDTQGAAIASGIALIAVIARFTVLRGNAESFAIGKLPIYSYGVMLGLSLVVGWYLTLGLAVREGLPKETMANNYVVTAIAAVVGSRVLYILTNLHEFDSVASMFAMRRGGLVAYGGFLGGLAGSYFFLRRHKIPLLPWADVAVPSLASGLMITRIGCYLFGCDYGKRLGDDAPGWLKKLGSFPRWTDGMLDQGSGSPAWSQHVKQFGLPQTADYSFPVHPTQLYESLVGAGLLALLLWARRRQKFRGEIFFLFAFAYGVCRYLLEILRGDGERGEIPPALPEHILIPLGLALLAVGWVIGFSNMIENVTVRRVAQVAGFLPAIAVYFAMKPATFATAASVELSTSQFIALVSGLAASVAFAVFYKAALAHPQQAMALGLPEPGVAPTVAEDNEDDDEEEEAPVRKAAPKKTARSKVKAKAKAAKKPEPEASAEEGDGGGEEERAPAARSATKKDEGGDAADDGDGEPVKAG